jgi:tryptophanyl-tRNA synthetase
MERQTVVSGIRATGKLHIGNYFGAMRNFVTLQEKFNCYFFIADYHSLTTEEDADALKVYLLPIVKDYLAVGLDPNKCTLFAQSSVPEIAELALLLSMVQPKSELEGLPTWKEKEASQNAGGKVVSSGLFFYPVLMAADILIQKANIVPVGKDQLPHLEFTRDVARRFNNRYGPTFPACDAFEGVAIKVPGLDGTEKMGKSEGNAIDLMETPESVIQKLSVAVTDTNRKRRQDTGNPYICNLFALHELISSPETVENILEGCKSASIGCLECKKMLGDNINKLLAPFQERYRAISDDYARQVLIDGGNRARITARQTVEEVREKMGLPSLMKGG